MRAQEILNSAIQQAQVSSTECSRREIEWLMESASGVGRIDVILDPDRVLTSEEKDRFLMMLARRLQGEPVQYITGAAPFYGREFMVNPDVLIPRPETELLVEWAIARAEGHSSMKLLDIGTGSGCIPISVRLEAPHVYCVGMDISAAALDVARINADRLHAEVCFVQSDIFEDEALAPFVEPFDILVSNPPYIPDSESASLQGEVRDHEPHLALFSGPDPLHFYRRIASVAKSLVARKGLIGVEVHSSYAGEVSKIFDDQGIAQIEVHSDLAGRERIVSGRIV